MAETDLDYFLRYLRQRINGTSCIEKHPYLVMQRGLSSPNVLTVQSSLLELRMYSKTGQNEVVDIAEQTASDGKTHFNILAKKDAHMTKFFLGCCRKDLPQALPEPLIPMCVISHQSSIHSAMLQVMGLTKEVTYIVPEEDLLLMVNSFLIDNIFEKDRSEYEIHRQLTAQELRILVETCLVPNSRRPDYSRFWKGMYALEKMLKKNLEMCALWNKKYICILPHESACEFLSRCPERSASLLRVSLSSFQEGTSAKNSLLAVSLRQENEYGKWVLSESEVSLPSIVQNLRKLAPVPTDYLVSMGLHDPIRLSDYQDLSVDEKGYLTLLMKDLHIAPTVVATPQQARSQNPSEYQRNVSEGAVPGSTFSQLNNNSPPNSLPSSPVKDEIVLHDTDHKRRRSDNNNVWTIWVQYMSNQYDPFCVEATHTETVNTLKKVIFESEELKGFIKNLVGFFLEADGSRLDPKKSLVDAGLTDGTTVVVKLTQ